MTTVTIQVNEEYDMGLRDGWAQTSDDIERKLTTLAYEAHGRLLEGQTYEQVCSWLLDHIEFFDMPAEP